MCHIYDPRGPPLAPKNKPKYAQTNQIFHCPCSNRVARGHYGCKSFMEHPCHVNLFTMYPYSPYITYLIPKAHSGQNMPKLTRLTHPTPCPCSNRAAGGHHGMKSPIEHLCPVNLFHLYLGGPFATSMTLGDSLRPKEPARVLPN